MAILSRHFVLDCRGFDRHEAIYQFCDSFFRLGVVPCGGAKLARRCVVLEAWYRFSSRSSAKVDGSLPRRARTFALAEGGVRLGGFGLFWHNGGGACL